MALKCITCKVECQSKEMYNEHIESKNHMNRNAFNNSVIINNVPSVISFDDLNEFFAEYSGIKSINVIEDNPKTIIIECQNIKSVQSLLSTKHYINNIKLDLCKRNYIKEAVDEYVKYLYFGRIKTIIDVQLSFEDQLPAFFEFLYLSCMDIKLRYASICSVINNLFKPIFPKCKTYTFGSTTIGLAFKCSDLDIYLNIGVPVNSENSNIKGPHIITLEKLFSIVEKILRKTKTLFSKCISIPNAKVPIIKFLYLPTAVHCDISFKSTMAVYNSQLVKFCLCVDPYFRPTMRIIKYWLHCCESRSFIGISKYALSMLFIFYLQQEKLLPSIENLKRNCTVPVIIQGWQVNFSEKLPILMTNNKSIPELLLRFFDFYKQYDFNKNVICPCDGKSYSKELFETVDYLPASMQQYKDYVNNTNNSKLFLADKPMCVQDPIELNNNLTHSIKENHVEKFQTFCALSAQIVKNSSKNNYQDLLVNIFNFKKEMVTNAVKKSDAKMFVSIHPNEFFIKNQMIYDHENNIITLQNWFNTTYCLIKKFMHEVLNFTIDNIEEPNDNTMKFHCTGTIDILNNRKIKNIKSFLNPLEKEIEITRCLNLQKNNTNKNNNVAIECQFHKFTEPALHLQMTVTDKGCSKSTFPIITNYLMLKMTSVIQKTYTFMYNHRIRSN